MMQRFAKIINGWKPSAIFAKIPQQMFNRVLNMPLVIALVTLVTFM